MSIFENIALIEAVGLDPRHMTAHQVYEVSRKIISDATLTRASLKFLDGSVLPKGARVKAIGEMSPAAKKSLRARILSH
jgi:hypothetical protein